MWLLEDSSLLWEVLLLLEHDDLLLRRLVHILLLNRLLLVHICGLHQRRLRVNSLLPKHLLLLVREAVLRRHRLYRRLLIDDLFLHRLLLIRELHLLRRLLWKSDLLLVSREELLQALILTNLLDVRC
jgi:hypothetical protein